MFFEEQIIKRQLEFCIPLSFDDIVTGLWTAPVVWSWGPRLLSARWTHFVQKLQCQANPSYVFQNGHGVISCNNSPTFKLYSVSWGCFIQAHVLLFYFISHSQINGHFHQLFKLIYAIKLNNVIFICVLVSTCQHCNDATFRMFRQW
jgi:hypothetical protein